MRKRDRMNSGCWKKAGALLTALVLLLALSGCENAGTEEKKAVPTLAPAVVAWEAPDGDQSVREPADYRVYQPGENSLQLISREISLSEADLNDTVTELVQALLDDVNESRDWTQSRGLALYREHPIEISGGICTVNLAASALQLPSYREYFELCLALAATLCELDEISYVNVLTADQSVGLDITGTLAMGTLTGNPQGNLPVLWEQMEARRTPPGQSAAGTPLNTQATVYYPLPEGQGIACLSKMMNFPGQTPRQMSETLLDEITAAVREAEQDETLPSLLDYQLHEPVASTLDEGGRLITFSFRENLQDLTKKWGTDLPCLAAALTWTVTTLIPGVSAVCFRVGDKPLTDELSGGRFQVETLWSGMARRSAFEEFLAGSAAVYFIRDGNLARVRKAVNRHSADSPRTQLKALLQGPDPKERENGLQPALPDTLQENDILGIAAQGDTLLVNLSSDFLEAIADRGAENEALLCYSMVNTLCENSGKKRVCFFFEGEQKDRVAGEVFWSGEFLYNPDL